MNDKVNKGGWMGVVKNWYGQRHGGNGDRGDVKQWMGIKSSAYMLDASFVRHIIGDSEEFDVMGAQRGHNSYYSNGNHE